ncbi:N-acyl-D-amino-acid deacylase [Microbacterium sp. AG1240]|uniref:N-acyl-D-amino-acid deacylase family protein n=1 Tax=Microbacterium sp. AG1240 TaxID=2183992 RepID=UPI000EADB6EF|nr:D-aminoacylase [Microbacterium sp. AG1240]RKT31628.1 N-acyl-D-amino-acid deacylase [Microbacterium sp. AG1240]
MLITGAVVVDGTGAPRYEADVRVAGARIETVSPRIAPKADEDVLDAAGLILAPGFIDMHAHSDLEVLRPGSHTAKLRQGVTTEVIGQDGLSYAPVDRETLADVRERIGGWHGDLPDARFTWRTVDAYLAALDEGIPTNCAYLVPQGNVRMMVVGHGAQAATAGQIDRMRGLVREGLDAGAFGLSSGLTYAPGMHASYAELAALCEVVAEYGGYWSPHTRSYGRAAIEAYSEVISIARDTGCAVHLTHATMNFAPNRGRANELLDLVDSAVADGVDVTLDSYPYLAGATTLAALLPARFTEGGVVGALALLGDADAVEGLRVAWEETGTDASHGEIMDWDALQISSVESAALAECAGRTISQLVGEPALGSPPTGFDAAVQILRRDRLRTGILMHIGDEANVRAIMGHPRHMGGSDGILVGARPHPRGWGTFPRYIREYAGRQGIFTLEECIRHLAGSPARRLGLTDRGTVTEGAVADLAVFDPLRIGDVSTYDDPRRDSDGMTYVTIGGELVIDRGRPTQRRAGRALRHSAGGAR